MKKKLTLLFLMALSLSIIYGNEYTQYKLQNGETLWRVSKKYNISLEKLCSINNIEDAAKVKSGTVIKVPVNSQQKNVNQQYIIHVLKKDETLYKLSKNYGISINTLCRINEINDITKIRAGTKIKIPVEYNYLDYNIPADGKVTLFSSAHFKGIYIFTEQLKEKRSVCAIEDGQVSYVDNIPGYGPTIFIRHVNGLISTYSGLQEIYVKNNSIIKKNQVIGLAGNISRQNQYGILFSLQYNGRGLKFDMERQKFIKINN